jgi:hypothetical protein
MKIRIALISLLSIFLLFLATGAAAVYIVFTPERISPIVRKQAARYLACDTGIGRIELTFFSTFPQFGLKVENLTLLNPMQGVHSDTLFHAEKLSGVIDLKAYWQRDEIILSGITVQNGVINPYIAADGRTNFDIFPTDTTSGEKDELKIGLVDLGKVEFRKINVLFSDDTLKMKIGVKDMDATISGILSDDLFSGHLKMQAPAFTFEYLGEKFLDNVALRLNAPAEIKTSLEKVQLKNAQASVNNLELLLNGTINLNLEKGDILSDLEYRFTDWSANELLALVPPTYQSYLEGITMTGLLSSGGTITGLINDSVMPLLNVDLSIRNGEMIYTALPFPLKEIEGDLKIYTDLNNDDISYVLIQSFNFSTPQSTIKGKGTLHNLFSDIQCRFEAIGNVLLDEFNPLLPREPKANLSGRVRGSIKTSFLMSQIEKMELENIRIEGDLTGENLNVELDSLWLRTAGSTSLKFSLPNVRPTERGVRFAYADIKSDHMEAGKTANFQAYFKNAALFLETSDLRDSTRVPHMIVAFAMDTLAAWNDTLALSLKDPGGKATILPRVANPAEPHMLLAYKGNDFFARMNEESVSIRRIQFDTEIENDNSQTDLFLQWLVKGFIDIEQGKIHSPFLTHNLEIPSIKMDFDPENLDISDSRLIIDKSDYELSGSLKNVLSYFRGDSILRGRLDFKSSFTDVLQLMNLTNGLGNEEEIKPAASEGNYTGPYMVPKGIDILLATYIDQASFGVDTAVNISGRLRINDGTLVLDDYTFATSAARMQLTSLYRTPRKNHLLIALDYHMLDVEIERLLKMIPDLDTLMPMLRSFRGKGEFHLAFDGYLDSTYTIKKSTIRCTSSIRGENLVLMDGETFSDIARTLRFSKKAENLVDSLAAVFTVFRDEIDIYPFTMVMDKYKAVISGRHNFDMTYNYHISVINSPVPLRFALKISGNPDNWKIDQVEPLFAQNFRPASRRILDDRRLELRTMIRETLLQGLNE